MQVKNPLPTILFRTHFKILLLLFVFVSIQNYAQEGDYYLGPTHYSFINYDSNLFSLPEHSARFNAFFSSLNTLIADGAGQVNIVHFGGSHIQADIYTHLIRQRLLDLSPGISAGRGLIFPFDVAETNNPWNYKVKYAGKWIGCKCTRPQDSCSLGVMGITVTTSDSVACVSIIIDDDYPYTMRFNRVKVFHEPTEYQLKLRIGNTVSYGNYFTDRGYSLFVLPDEHRQFSLQIERDTSISTFVLQGFSLENDRPGIRYNAIGVNGTKLSSYLRCEKYTPQLSVVKPKLVIFSIGTNDGNTSYFNDSLYYAEYCQLLDSTLKAAPNTAILLTVPNDSYLFKKYPNKNTQVIRETIYRVAQKYNCAVWDLYAIMGGFKSANDWYSLGLMKRDHIHFTRKGYLLKGELFFSAFLKTWERYLTDNSTSNYKHLINTILQP